MLIVSAIDAITLPNRPPAPGRYQLLLADPVVLKVCVPISEKNCQCHRLARRRVTRRIGFFRIVNLSNGDYRKNKQESHAYK